MVGRRCPHCSQGTVGREVWRGVWSRGPPSKPREPHCDVAVWVVGSFITIKPWPANAQEVKTKPEPQSEPVGESCSCLPSTGQSRIWIHTSLGKPQEIIWAHKPGEDGPKTFSGLWVFWDVCANHPPIRFSHCRWYGYRVEGNWGYRLRVGTEAAEVGWFVCYLLTLPSLLSKTNKTTLVLLTTTKMREKSVLIQSLLKAKGNSLLPSFNVCLLKVARFIPQTFLECIVCSRPRARVRV